MRAIAPAEVVLSRGTFVSERGLGDEVADFRPSVSDGATEPVFPWGFPTAESAFSHAEVFSDLADCRERFVGTDRHWYSLKRERSAGAFSGKDPSKVDRSAAYATRWVAKNVVAAGLAARCEIQVAYAIGKAHPVGLYVECFGTETVPLERIQAAITEVFDLRPAAIIRDLDLLRPIYRQTAAYGHFGRELPDFTWERTDRVEALRAAVG